MKVMLKHLEQELARWRKGWFISFLLYAFRLSSGSSFNLENKSEIFFQRLDFVH